MDTMATMAVETFSAAVASPRPREDVADMDGYTRCGSGMGQSRDD